MEKVIKRTLISLDDPAYFCNKSWTLSYDMNTKSWISFHSYIPNFYIAENNFFYSGLNGCCAEFDFIVGVLGENTTTTSTTSTSSTTTTAIPRDCGIDGGEATMLIYCGIDGGIASAIYTPCERPNGLTTYYPVTGYIIPSTMITTISTASSSDACNAETFMNLFGGVYIDVVFTTIVMQSSSLTVGQTCYLNIASDCTLVPDGWYFTESTALTNIVFHIVGGILVELFDCAATTTTTTTIIPTCNYITLDTNDAFPANFAFTYCGGGSSVISINPGAPQTLCLQSVDAYTSNGIYTIGVVCPSTTTTTTIPLDCGIGGGSADEVFTTTSTTTTTTTGLCLNCPPGYTAVIGECYIEETITPTSPVSPETLVAMSNIRYTTIGTIVFDNTWNYNGTGSTFNLYTSGSFWINPIVISPNGSTTNGIMNKNAVWSTVTANFQTVGFPVCFDIAVEKQYYIGLGCDNFAEIKVDGVSILLQDPTALGAMFTAQGWVIPFDVESTFRAWFVYPVTLTAGKHIIELIGHNDVSVAAVGMDIYDMTESALMACTSYADMGAGLIFSTKDEVGQLVKIGNKGQGYTCPVDYVLGYCDLIPMCYKITYIPCPAPTTTTTTTIL